MKRFVSVYFPFLVTDWCAQRNPRLRDEAFVLTAPAHGRPVITHINPKAAESGIRCGMVLADAKAMVSALVNENDPAGLPERLLTKIAAWCIRFTPVAAIDLPAGLVLDASGCTQLWGGEAAYAADIEKKLRTKGYAVKIAVADSIGAAWAIARFGRGNRIIPGNESRKALMNLPPAALRIEPETTARLEKLGLRRIKDFIGIPAASLRRRFGALIITQLRRAIGAEEEYLTPVIERVAFSERLPCMEPIRTRKAIEIALAKLIEALCISLKKQRKGIRAAEFLCYTIDSRIEKIRAETGKSSQNREHLFKLFELKICGIAPGPGIELFVLNAIKTEEYKEQQQTIRHDRGPNNDREISELLDRLSARYGPQSLQRWLPAAHHWPERSLVLAANVSEPPLCEWQTDKPRPLRILKVPQAIEVTAPIPDYPPMLFRYRGELHKIVRADGPERIEQEWWIEEGLHRDYYCVENEKGARYWLFRSGHYDAEKTYGWFLHGFFA